MFILETDRLGLRPMVEEDAPSLHPVFSIPRSCDITRLLSLKSFIFNKIHSIYAGYNSK
ncbi:hypothetical protein B2K_39460 [Paenibacillus mucilaginosus K02]|uniref:Acetyltransferase n=1 Tax=Paenibacillus mucilaginosus K02 TaxID=997761 RepID=R9UPF7_9BACL|nr:hypothetical protein B2K_39460 [Paenibacillus mucilaginosus K02]